MEKTLPIIPPSVSAHNFLHQMRDPSPAWKKNPFSIPDYPNYVTGVHFTGAHVKFYRSSHRILREYIHYP